MQSFKGLMTALITPFTKSGDLDIPSFEKLLHFQVQSGVQAILLLGTTGESPTVTFKERIQLVDIAKKTLPSSVSLFLGCGTNNTTTTIELSQHAEKSQADGIVLIMPYYNRPPQKGLIEHCKQTAHATSLPIILYEHPTRTGVSLNIESVKELIQTPNIIGIKEGKGCLERLGKLHLLRNDCRPDFGIYSGSDEMNLPFLSLKADGLISVVSNLFPQQLVNMIEKIKENELKIAQEIHYELLPFIHSLFKPVNPLGIKFCLYNDGLINNAYCRPPLCDLESYEKQDLIDALNRLKQPFSKLESLLSSVQRYKSTTCGNENSL